MEVKEQRQAIARKIRERREKIGYSQKELARVVGRTETTISQIELGNANPALNTLILIAKALDISLKKLTP